MAHRRTRNVVIAVLGALALIGIGFARDGMQSRDEALTVFDGSEGEAADSGSTGTGAQGSSGGQHSRASGGSTDSLAVTSDFADSTAGLAAGEEGQFNSGHEDGGDMAGGVPLPPLADSERIIKDGRLEVEVPKGGFDRAFNALVRLAGKAGGEVVSSQSSREENRASGEVTIRVPAQRFDQLLASTHGIGTIEHREMSSQDVSGEFVDLQARLRHLQAQEQFYLGLLGKAKVVGDAIAINQHLSSVQAEMEQVQGRLRLLDERSTYSRLTVSLYEPGVTPLLTDRTLPPQGPLGMAWREALLAFQETIGALLVGAFTLAPLLALALLGWALWRRLRPRPAAFADPRPAVEEDAGPLPVG